MRITKIKIKDFGGIQDLPDIDLTKDGKNLLVFGENGSGKSSLFNSVRQFFRCSTSGLNIRDFQHRYIATPVPSISISILEDAETLNTYAWDSEGSTPDGVAQLLETAIMSPFFDYRILKGSHGPNESGGNLFELILNLILRSPNPNSGITFGDEFTEINVIHEELLHAQNWLEIDTPLTTDQIQDNDLYEAMQSRRTDLLSKFAEGIVAHLAQIKDRTNDLLSFFKNDLQITFRVVPGDYQTLVSVNFPEVHIDALLYGMAAPDHTSWLNEARLSSLALSIFLSNLLVQPKPQIKLLVLDDVLIGLDMGNRYPLLDILREQFHDWQIILLTHDYIWFDVVRMGLDGAHWEIYEIYRVASPGNPDSNVLKRQGQGWASLLNVAEKYLTEENDARAAAVYARAAFEIWVKKRAAEKRLKVTYVEEPRLLASSDIWDAIKQSLKVPGGVPEPKEMICRNLEASRKIVLNGWSHGLPNSATLSEVQRAIDAVRVLDNL